MYISISRLCWYVLSSSIGIWSSCVVSLVMTLTKLSHFFTVKLKGERVETLWQRMRLAGVTPDGRMWVSRVQALASGPFSRAHSGAVGRSSAGSAWAPFCSAQVEIQPPNLWNLSSTKILKTLGQLSWILYEFWLLCQFKYSPVFSSFRCGFQPKSFIDGCIKLCNANNCLNGLYWLL
jgi:hypothetical protein